MWGAGALLGGNDSPPIRGTAQDAAIPLASAPPSTSQPVAPSVSAAPTVPISATATVTSAQSLPAGPPQPCPDNVITVTASVGQPSYRVGQRPVFALHITNTGPVACTRDVSRQLRVLLVVPAAGGNPLWSSGDCYAPGDSEVPLLRPGQELDYTVTWSGRTSTPGCAPAGGSG